MVKSDVEPAMLVVRNSVMKYHGRKVIPEQPGKGEKAEDGLAAEAGKTVRVYICIFIS